MLNHIRSIRFILASAALALLSAGTLHAQDAAASYAQLCASCHDSGFERAPDREILRAMPPERILAAMEGGAMVSMASGLTGAGRRAIAEFLAETTFGEALDTTPQPEAMCTGAGDGIVDPSAGPLWNGWGPGTHNTRYQEESMAGLGADDVARLELKWAFGYPGELSADAQPTVASGRVFVGSPNGYVYSLSAATGCIHWYLQAANAVRAAVSVGSVETDAGARLMAYIGDRGGNVYAVDAATGVLVWEREVESHPLARVTGAPRFHAGRLYVGSASGEELASATPTYECCTFRGSLTVLDGATGEEIWRTYTITETPTRTRDNAIGVQMWGPSGSPIWTSPAIDVDRNAVYVTTGNNYSDPPTSSSDAFIALDLDTGKVLWSRQVTAFDSWNSACRMEVTTNCSENEGPDFDFASGPILATLSNGRNVLVAGQKSGVVHALDPDRMGEILWQVRIGEGGINGGVQWGSAADESNVYVALSDLGRLAVPNSQATRPDPNVGGGMFALRLEDGEQAWHTPPEPCDPNRERCSPAQSAAVSAISGVAFSGSVDGHLRAYSTSDGSVIFDFDSVRTYDTVNGVAARGGSMNVGGPAVSGGMVFVNSGYAANGMPGNVLLAFSVDGN